jgi:hypothetical protein
LLITAYCNTFRKGVNFDLSGNQFLDSIGAMMKLFLKEVAQAKGYTNAKHLTDAMSQHYGARISYSTIYPLWDDEAQLWSRTTFDKLCSFLNVPAGMLIQHIPGEYKLELEAKPDETQSKNKTKGRKSKKKDVKSEA